MPQLINLTQHTNPLDHTTVAIELTMREVAHLALLLGCTGHEVTEEIALFQGNDPRVANLYGFLSGVVRDAEEATGFDMDGFVSPRLVFDHDYEFDESEPF